jgi:murein DD-endopeptidase MepM/ murein hydrolase activator NlpD
VALGRVAAELRGAAALSTARGRLVGRARTAPPRNGRMLWPSDGPLTSRYSYRRHPIYGDRRLHAGIDIGSGSGAGIIAAAAGTVLLSYYSES